MGSSHVDRNGPTKFYPTIREARRGSGPRPTAATARSARAPRFSASECAPLSQHRKLRARKRRSRREREGEKAWWRWCNTVYGESDDRAYPESLSRGRHPSGKGRRQRDVPRFIARFRESVRCRDSRDSRGRKSAAYVVIFQVIVLPFF